MDSVEDSHAVSDNSETDDDTIDMKNKRVDLDLGQPKHRDEQYERNLLKNAQRTLTFLEHQSLVDFLEADGEYIVSGGRDHDINVWDAVESTHIRRLTGHSGPVTGLYLYGLGQRLVDRIIVSSSEDGTIRQWSLNKGEELRKFETDSLITCMGVIHQTLAVTGNQRGYMEVRHLSTGEIYSSILAHFDPIDVMVVENNYACTAVFDVPSCLKVWEIQFEQITCIYRIDESSNLEFTSLALWDSTLFMGALQEQKLHVVNFKTDENWFIDLERTSGTVNQVKVVNGWILTCSECKKISILDVHRIGTYDHFGTFKLDIQKVFAITAMESQSSLKIVVGGSALVVLNFDFLLMQKESNIASKSFPMTYRLNSKEIKQKSHFTLQKSPRNNCSDGENSGSDEHNVEDDETILPKNVLPIDEELVYNSYKSIHPLSEAIHSRLSKNIGDVKTSKENDEIRSKTFFACQHSVFQPNMFPFSKLRNINERSIAEIEHMQAKFHSKEPRVIKKEIEEMLDKLGKEFEPAPCNKEVHEVAEEKEDVWKKGQTDDKCKDKCSIKDEEQNYLEAIEEESTVIMQSDLAEEITDELQLPSRNKNGENTQNGESSNKEMVEEIDKESTKPTKQKSKDKKQKNKSDKKQNEKNKQNKCIVI